MTSFEQLERAVASIANHADIAEKRLAMSECVDDIESRYSHGSLTPSQRRRLVAILLGLDR